MLYLRISASYFIELHAGQQLQFSTNCLSLISSSSVMLSPRLICPFTNFIRAKKQQDIFAGPQIGVFASLNIECCTQPHKLRVKFDKHSSSQLC